MSAIIAPITAREEFDVDSDILVSVRVMLHIWRPCAHCKYMRTHEGPKKEMREYVIYQGGLYTVFIASCDDPVCTFANSNNAEAVKLLLAAKEKVEEKKEEV